jgi:hypothetical protein
MPDLIRLKGSDLNPFCWGNDTCHPLSGLKNIPSITSNVTAGPV